MSIFDKLFGVVETVFPPAGLLKKVGDAFLGSDPTKDAKATWQDIEPAVAAAIVERDRARDAHVAATLQTEIEGRARIIEAEMAQGDSYTKRARPTLVYAGLVLFFLEFGIRGWLVLRGLEMPEGTIVPVAFTAGWTTAVSVWMVGRSVEKVTKAKNGGAPTSSRFLKAIVG
ncbi:MAG: 3TM-type holin [Planctomycetota bacterium]|jgi:hypothetical protein